MAEKKSFLEKIDDAAAAKGEGIKALWQFVKFLVVSLGVTIIQLILANTLPLIFDHMTTTLPEFLQKIFVPESLFDVSTEVGARDFTKYVINGVVTWGYVLPFFLSNALANVYGYIQNKKTTFKSDAPTYCFVIYIFVLTALILFSTWFQAFIYSLLSTAGIGILQNLARTIASLAAGMIQLIVLFPLEKFVLLKEKVEEVEETEEATKTEKTA
ncbi:MAG: hypothetical protein GX241_04115 [Ruminococcaceae bacterium]|nr:hypothetical protein [Oscillospiraceae bacterium]